MTPTITGASFRRRRRSAGSPGRAGRPHLWPGAASAIAQCYLAPRWSAIVHTAAHMALRTVYKEQPS